MDSIDWNQVKHFRQEEFDDPLYPGSGSLMHYKVVYMLDHLREVAGCPIIVTAAVDVAGKHGHSPNSFHLAKNSCKAVDFYFKTSVEPRYQYWLVEKADWHVKGERLPIGFHVDTREHVILQRWVRRNGEYQYLLGVDN